VLLFCKIVEFREVLILLEVLAVAFKKGLFSEAGILTEALLAPNLDGSDVLPIGSLEVRALDSFSISFCSAGSF
tara:strand:+ start:36 stop:257 length:222 start_codon:yes stop_codon:yes gene_type:complete